ncbi:MAG: SPOR domain-containing protein [Gammaproteobacteria bacterium]
MMLKMASLTFAVLVSACAHTSAPAPDIPSKRAEVPIAAPTVPTVASHRLALAADCTVVRALDGRAVCAEQLPGGAARAATDDRPAALAVMPAERPAERHDYVVIGSFSTRENAARWAAYNAGFAPEIQRVDGSDGPMYRVLVGPLGADSAPLMRDILGAVGIAGSWPLATTCQECGGPTTLPERKLAEVAPRR